MSEPPTVEVQPPQVREPREVVPWHTGASSAVIALVLGGLFQAGVVWIIDLFSGLHHGLAPIVYWFCSGAVWLLFLLLAFIKMGSKKQTLQPGEYPAFILGVSLGYLVSAGVVFVVRMVT